MKKIGFLFVSQRKTLLFKIKDECKQKGTIGQQYYNKFSKYAYASVRVCLCSSDI